ncbi:MAG: ABC transporter ATP-binding protein [Desulfurococcales archaeon]|nr:ABC transporter ATP-binding protein [Desulfurococcales archaeon]
MESVETPIVEMKNIVKVYPDGVKALDGVSLRLYRGMVHALLGENGAGKTTLMRILYGEIKPSRGEIYVDGEPVRFHTPIDAIRKGIAMIYQHPRMVPTLTIGENIDLYFDSAGIPPEERQERLKRAEEVTGFHIPLDSRVEDSPIGVLQRAEIVRSLAAGSRVMILDEPTTNLTPLEVEGLFKAIDRMKTNGVAIVYITHRLPEIERIADIVTVLRKGRVVASEVPRESLTREELARLMVGEIPQPARRTERKIGKPIVKIKSLRARKRIQLAIEELEVREGEILGVAGVEGNGQEELVYSILGVIEPEAGTVELLDKRVQGPSDFLARGGAYVPGDRTKALVSWFSIAENLAFLVYAHEGPSFMPPTMLSRLYAEIRDAFKIVAKSPWAPVATLSGGNQQKLLVGSQLYLKPRVIVAVNPTRGLDVATTRYVRNLLVEYASKGAAVILVSSDLDEILEVSDRIIVLYKGRVSGELAREEATPERLGVLMGGGG